MHKDPINLHVICRLGDIDAVSQVCKKFPSLINQKDTGVINSQLGWSPLYRISAAGDTQIAKTLLSHGADPNIVNPQGEIPLHQSSETYNYELAEILLFFNSDPNTQRNDGETPLHISSFKGDCKMVKILLESDANPNIQNFTVILTQNYRTPLHYAVDCNFVECALEMIIKGADPYIKDIDNNSALDLASSLEVETLLRNSYKRESSLSDFINPFVELAEAAEGTTYLISDLGEDKASVTGTERPKLSARVSSSELKEIFGWLQSIHLEELYETLAEAGYDNSSAMMQQMKGPMPITEHDLAVIGVNRPGHRKRILWKLEQDASQKHKRMKSNGFLRCCAQIKDGTGSVISVPSLKQVFRELEIEEYSDRFASSGYDNYEIMLAQSGTKYGISKEILSCDVGVRDNRVVRKILNRVNNDLLSLKQPDIVFDEGKMSACEFCIIT